MRICLLGLVTVVAAALTPTWRQASPLTSTRQESEGVAVATEQSYAPGCADGGGRGVVAPGMEAVDVFIERAAALGAFSGSVLLARGDSLLLHRGYGLASERPCVWAGPETVYHLGSLAKQFAAVAVLRLEEEGRLAVDDPITEHLPGVPADKRNITIHQLLTHTSGLPADVFGYGAVPDSGRDAAFERILSADLESVPGAEYRYSNAGYTLLGRIIETASGDPLDVYIRSELLRPTGLERTGFVGDSTRFGVEDMARGFWGRYSTPSLRTRTPSWTRMPGEMVASTGDLHRWFRALRDGDILRPETIERMFSPHAADYGYGWHVRRRPDGSTGVVFHNGDEGVYAAALRHYPRTDLVAIATTNLVVQDVKQHDDILNNALEIMDGGTGGLPPVVPESSPPPEERIPAGGGGAFTLDIDAAGRLWLAPQGCVGVAVLFAHLDGVRERCAAELARTVARAEELDRTAAACEARRGEPVGVQLLGEWSRLMCELRSSLGPLRRIEGVVARPLSWNDGRAVAWTRHVHRDGDRIVTWLWQGESLVEVWSDPAVTAPHAVRIAPVAASEHVMFDWFTGAAVPVRIRRTDDGDLEVRVGDSPM